MSVTGNSDQRNGRSSFNEGYHEWTRSTAIADPEDDEDLEEGEGDNGDEV